MLNKCRILTIGPTHDENLTFIKLTTILHPKYGCFTFMVSHLCEMFIVILTLIIDGTTARLASKLTPTMGMNVLILIKH